MDLSPNAHRIVIHAMRSQIETWQKESKQIADSLEREDDDQWDDVMHLENDIGVAFIALGQLEEDYRKKFDHEPF